MFRTTVTLIAVMAGLVACDAGESGIDQKEFLTIAAALAGDPGTAVLFLRCSGDGPTSVETNFTAVMRLAVVDAETVTVFVHPGCSVDAKVTNFEETQPNRHLIDFFIPPFTCPFPFKTIDGEPWAGTLNFNSSSMFFMTVISNDRGIIGTTIGSLFEATLTRTDPGKSATCEYSYFFPDPSP